MFAMQCSGADRQVDVVLIRQCGKCQDRGKYREPPEHPGAASHFDGMGSEKRPAGGPWRTQRSYPGRQGTEKGI